MNNIGKETNVGRIVYENDNMVLTVEEKENKTCFYALGKVEGHIYYPLGFMLGSSCLDYEHKKL